MKAKLATKQEQAYAEKRREPRCHMCATLLGKKGVFVTISTSKGTATEVLCTSCAGDLLRGRIERDPGPKLPGVE